MTQTNNSNRIVVIAGNASATTNDGYRAPAPQQVPAQRIVIIKNGEYVGSKPGR